MSFSKKIISVWIIANILFIPSFLSAGVVPLKSQDICFVHIHDKVNTEDIKQGKLKLKAHCENCNFFHDNDLSIITFPQYTIISKLVGNLIINKVHHYDENKILHVTARAPPTLA